MKSLESDVRFSQVFKKESSIQTNNTNTNTNKILTSDVALNRIGFSLSSK